MDSNHWHTTKLVLTLAGLLFVSRTELAAQGTLLVTGGGQPIISASRFFSLDTNLTGLRLLLDFGFSTEEALLPGAFGDSFSLTLQPAGGLEPILYFTMDGSAIVWAPITPGTFPISSNSITRTPIPFPLFMPNLPNQMSFHIDASIPDGFAGQPFTLYFDLFDNGNASRSLAWFNEPVVVPEPSTVALLGLAVLAWLCTRKFRR